MYQMKKYQQLFFLLLFSVFTLSAQVSPPKKEVPKVYKDIQTLSNKSGFSQFVHRLLFKSTSTKTPSKDIDKQKKELQKLYDKSECKIIRNIYIETLDPFGFSSDNEERKPEKGFEKLGNRLHIKTKKWTIKNLLLIKDNEYFDSIIVKESERILRSQRYIRSVVIKPIDIANSDSVDVSVRVLDSWSLTPNGSISSSRGNFEVTERNILGLGHEIENNFSKRFNENQKGYAGSYKINNIKNTYINASFGYENTFLDNVTKFAKIERQFISPLTRNAGGILIQKQNARDSLPSFTNGNFALQPFKTNRYEAWYGHAMQVFKGKSVNSRLTNVVLAVGYQQLDYQQKPSFDYDVEGFFASENLYLASIGFNTRKFIQDKYVFNFDIVEDIPIGKMISITGGFQTKNNQTRSYFGGRFAYGDLFAFGYLNTNIEIGTYINSGNNEEKVMRFEANYFTKLLEFGNWKLRQFIRSSFVIGWNRNSSIKDRIVLDSNGFEGFSNPLLSGTKKVMISFQTQTYAPGNWHGFHLSPYYNMAFGMIAGETRTDIGKKIFSKFSVGFLINNDYLVFNSFQLSFSYYPSIPLDGTHLIRSNTVKNNDLSLPDYQMGQPRVIGFQ
jgi:hypothetical protein